MANPANPIGAVRSRRPKRSPYLERRLASLIHKPPSNPVAVPAPPPGGWKRGVLPAAGEPLDILLPLGGGSRSNNWELRFALRSIERHVTGYRQIVIAGADPGFLVKHPQVKLLPMHDVTGNHEYRIASKLAKVLASKQTAPHVVLWNDDYVAWRPWDLAAPGAVPFWHKGELSPSVRDTRVAGTYDKALKATRDELTAVGRPVLNYDIHLPMVYERQRFLALANWWQLSGSTTDGLVVKSVYANNHLEAPGVQAKDCKLKSWDPGRIEAKTAGRLIWSYSDEALEGGLLRWLKARFSKRSAFESDGGEP